MHIYVFRPYTRQCLPNTSVAAVGPTLGPNASLRAIRQKREMETRGDQDNQDKNDLQGKIQFYQQFCASQQKAIAERKTQHVIGHSQLAGNETSRVNPCQFSTFKSSSGRAADLGSLDFANLNLGHRELGFNNTELNSTTSRDYYQPINKPRERSPNTASRQLDKQSYFFHGHKTEKDVDREVVMFEDSGMGNSVFKCQRANNVDEVTVSRGSMNCFGGTEKEKSYTGYDDKKLKYSTDLGVRFLAYEMRHDSENVKFLEKEGEIFKKSSNELLQEISTSKRRNFSFCNKEKIHRSLESLERSIDLPVVDCKSLDLMPERQPKFFHNKQRSLDSSQKLIKESVDPTVQKRRKRPSFFQRVGRSLHFLPREREKCQDLLKQEGQRINSQYSQTDQEKCEYFLRSHQESTDFLDQTSNTLASRAPAKFNLSSFDECDGDINAVIENSAESPLKNDIVQLKENTLLMTSDLNDYLKIETVVEVKHSVVKSYSDMNERSVRSDSLANNTEPIQSRLLKPVASVTTQETLSGNKDSLEVGYSISQLGRLYLQNLQHVGHADHAGLQSLEVADIEKRERYIEWFTRDDLDALSHGTNSSNSLAYGKPQGNLDILKGILLDIFVCICI